MSILKASIVSFVNNRLQENFTADEIDDEILTTLDDLASFNLLTADTATVAAVSGAVSIAVPSDFKMLITITPTDASGNQLRPLVALEGGFEAYKRLLTTPGDTIRDRPNSYVKKGNLFFIYPTLSGSFTFAIEYYRHHPTDLSSIQFNDSFRTAIKYGATYYAALFRNKVTYINLWRPIYTEERGKQIMLNLPEPAIVE